MAASSLAWDTSGRELTFLGMGGAMAHSSDRVPGALLCHNITPRRNQFLIVRQRNILKTFTLASTWPLGKTGTREPYSSCGRAVETHRLRCWCAGALSCVSDAVLVTGRFLGCMESGETHCWLADSTGPHCVSPLVCRQLQG